MKLLFQSLIFLILIWNLAAAKNNGLELNSYKHELLEKSFEHTDSLQITEVQKKSVLRAALYSAVLPGAGQAYNGSVWKTILFAGVEVAAWTAYFVYDGKGDQSDIDMRKYGDSYWSEQKYWSWLYYKAGQQGVENLPQYQTQTDQDGTVWLVDYDADVVNSLRYLEDELGHTHRLPETKTQQYYEMIYKYLTQFGNGWDDADFYASYYGNTNNMTAQMFAYRDMRNQTNDYYDSATAAVNVILINHLISALEAAWSTRSFNRQLEVRLSVHNKKYFDEQVQMYGVNLTW